MLQYLSFHTSVLFLFLCVVMQNGTFCLVKDYFEYFYLFYPLLCKVWNGAKSFFNKMEVACFYKNSLSSSANVLSEVETLQ